MMLQRLAAEQGHIGFLDVLTLNFHVRFFLHMRYGINRDVGVQAQSIQQSHLDQQVWMG